jgi:hypothetical protein
MASRPSVLKRQRERKREERAAQKREERTRREKERRDGGGAPVATREELDGYLGPGPGDDERARGGR